MVFGYLTAESQCEERAGCQKSILWNCRCACGNVIKTFAAYLTKGKKKSCGCRSDEMRSNSNSTHGGTFQKLRSPTYMSWAAMKQRCVNPRPEVYSCYGARGITVCERWIDSFENFLEDMGPRPEGMTLDRKDGSKGYEPSNCRWATRLEQANNTRTNVRVNYKGQSVTIAELSRITGINQTTLGTRILRMGWSLERAMQKPRARPPV